MNTLAPRKKKRFPKPGPASLKIIHSKRTPCSASSVVRANVAGTPRAMRVLMFPVLSKRPVCIDKAPRLSIQRAVHATALTSLVLAITACAAGQPRQIFQQTIALPDGRWTGPVEVSVPRRADHELRDFMYRAELSASCTPDLEIQFPDGEHVTMGAKDSQWQALLTARAAAPTPVTEPTPEPTPEFDETYNQGYVEESTGDDVGPLLDGAPAQDNTPAGPGATAVGVIAAAPSGRWVEQNVETWPGQLVFNRELPTRCARSGSWSTTHYTALDRDGLIRVWAARPQELANAKLIVTVFEMLGTEEEVYSAPAPRPAKVTAKAEVKAEVKAEIKVYLTPTSPQPAPKTEQPGAPRTEGATFVPGSWSWSTTDGKWVWVRGSWRAPSTTPALKGPSSKLPLPGCRWSDGQWVWVPGSGVWKWNDGYWLAPPSKTETPPPPQVPEQGWVAGAWRRTYNSFEWLPGYWGPPKPRVEVKPPSPRDGARWLAGRWANLSGKWSWLGGSWDTSGGHAPPAAKAETPPPSPAAGAVWLYGYWQWQGTAYTWVGGHWEVPPGVGYAWVPDPPDPQTGRSIGGRWILNVDIRVRP